MCFPDKPPSLVAAAALSCVCLWQGVLRAENAEADSPADASPVQTQPERARPGLPDGPALLPPGNARKPSQKPTSANETGRAANLREHDYVRDNEHPSSTPGTDWTNPNTPRVLNRLPKSWMPRQVHARLPLPGEPTLGESRAASKDAGTRVQQQPTATPLHSAPTNGRRLERPSPWGQAPAGRPTLAGKTDLNDFRTQTSQPRATSGKATTESKTGVAGFLRDLLAGNKQDKTDRGTPDPSARKPEEREESGGGWLRRLIPFRKRSSGSADS
jgi:hypothetical protein